MFPKPKIQMSRVRKMGEWLMEGRTKKMEGFAAEGEEGLFLEAYLFANFCEDVLLGEEVGKIVLGLDVLDIH
ncbi:hypothetical protein NEIELOOT_01962, partial [Neisseria elongata subsp. glycolytica ATCC 29315]